MRVGFIGLGTMGAGMALNLLKGGFKLTVTDLRKEAAERHIANGARTCLGHTGCTISRGATPR